MTEQFADGSRVEVVTNDPWDFVDADDSNVFQARVVSSAPHEDFQRLLLLRFDRPVASQDGQSDTFVAAIKSLSQSQSGGGVECWFVAADPTQVDEHSFRDIVSLWRGGLSARATVRQATDPGSA